MNEKQFIDDLEQLDKLLASVVNPALTRADHDSVRQLMRAVADRIKLSFKLEAEVKELKDEVKNHVVLTGPGDEQTKE